MGSRHPPPGVTGMGLAARLLAVLSVSLMVGACTGSDPVPPDRPPPGQAERAKTRALEAGATALQRHAAPDALNVRLQCCG